MQYRNCLELTGQNMSSRWNHIKSLCEEARLMGFHVSAHAGEAAGPESIWSAIRHLHVDRIRHDPAYCRWRDFLS